MKHYRLTLPEIRRMNHWDHREMILALTEKQSVGGNLHFATEEEYRKWNEQRRKR